MWYTTISLIFVYFHFGLKNVIYFSLQPFCGYFALQFKSKNKIWIYNVITLTVINYHKYVNSQIIETYNFNDFITTTAIFWINLRSLNYFLEVVTDEEQRKFNFNNILTSFAYCLYLPFLFTGPLVLYTNFKCILEKNTSKDLSHRLKELIINLMRYIFWFMVIEFVLHFCYITALSYQPQVIFFVLNYWFFLDFFFKFC